ncbi:uncharacterized protein LOC105938300 isoform X2 [Fundulus heteroclitus]|uniref:uncharacterized protein LOC105938300 isoform X2 n=1 Tax=Fundulus heteroclitus TaxID=8078 RepID=UPI000B366728|nr:uncharacterized protein LOC105938300 isoform X2 [Fundulus heteroclitus]
MPRESQEMEDFTTQYRKLNPRPLQPSVTRVQYPNRKIQLVERVPESPAQASFIPHPVSPSVKVKHLEDGSPTIKGDPRLSNFVSHYNDTFKRHIVQPTQPVQKPSSSIRMGCPGKSSERKTTYKTMYCQPVVCRSEKVKNELVHKPTPVYQDSWTTTFRDSFKSHKPEPIVHVKQEKNVSSFPRGDTDKKRNAERMSFTTNKFFFSDEGTYSRLCLPDPDLITKSRVQFGPSSLSDQIYRTTTSEQYSIKKAERPKPVVYPKSNILSGPKHEPYISTSAADYIPLNISKPRQCQTQQKTSIKFPLSVAHFSTTNREHFTAKPLIRQRPTSNQFCSHFVLN